jgi:ATP-dependent Lon protease
MHSLRELDFTGKYKEYFTLSSTISTRDRDGVQKTFSGLMKVLHPSGEATKDEVKELLKLSMEARKRVKDQLFRIDPTYDPVDFSFTDNETGEKISVKTLEEVEYPSLYYRNGEQAEVTGNVENVADKCDRSSQGEVVVEAKEAKEDSKTVLMQLGPKHVSIQANQRGVTYRSLFGDYLKGVSKVVIVDPFIYKAYQMDNLIDLIHLIYDLNQDSEETLRIELHTTIAPEKSQEQDQALLDIKDELAVEGIEFDFSYDANHDRMIVVDDKWVINLGRGLDIYEYCSRFSLKHASQRLRKCREFNVSIVQM